MFLFSSGQVSLSGRKSSEDFITHIGMPEFPYGVKWLLYKYKKKDLEERGLQVLI